MKVWFVSSQRLQWENFDIEPYLSRLTQFVNYAQEKLSQVVLLLSKNSNWMMSFAMHRQPHFKEQNDQQSITWVYGLLSNKPGNYIKNQSNNVQGKKLRKSYFII